VFYWLAIDRQPLPSEKTGRLTMARNSASLEVLLKLTGCGDQHAFANLYQQTSGPLLGIAYRILGRKQVAEDALQDAFVSVWKRAAQYDPGISQPMTWLASIVRNQSIDLLRTEKRRGEVSAQSPFTINDDDDRNSMEECSAESSVATSISQLEQLSSAVEAMQIKDCMGTLDAPCRQSMALAYYRGLSHTEVAAHMSVPLGTIKTWIRRGLEQLKFCLVTRGVEK
jgi:RNA polymerase sigma-70 factor, ECF subfamily